MVAVVVVAVAGGGGGGGHHHHHEYVVYVRMFLYVVSVRILSPSMSYLLEHCRRVCRIS